MLSEFSIDRKTLKELLATAMPMVISQGAFALMIFTDRYFMSLISPVHLAACLGGGVACYFCLSFFVGLFSYVNALVAQYYGAGHRDKCTRVLTQSFILCLFSLPLLLFAGWSVGYLFSAMGHDPVQVQLERSYFYILMLGTPISLFKICFASYFSGIGKTKIVMIVDSVGVVINIPLSYALIFGVGGLPEMGIVGAGIGTLIGTVLTLCLFIGFYFCREHRLQFNVAGSFVVDKGIIKRHLRFGLPSGIEMFLNIAAFNLFLLMFQSYGVAQGASAAIVLNWDILCYIPLMGMNIAIISRVGRFVGARDMLNVNKTIMSGFVMGLGLSGFLALVFVLFRHSLVDLFIRSGEDYQSIHDLSVFMMFGLAAYLMADAIIIISGAVLRGAGDTLWLMRTSVLLHWLMLAAQFVVIKVLDYGPRVSWMVFVCLILSMAVVYFIRLSSQHWRRPDVLERVMTEE